jgi:coproporphyrinogen III oxidase
MMSDIDRSAFETWSRSLQAVFAADLERLDETARFRRDRWDRAGGGGGHTWVLAGEGPIEKAAVNWSAVWGDVPPGLSEGRAASAESFYACGTSIIVHPRNPHAPTFHANLRYFETDVGRAWFGGGADLTPWYLYEDDARHFHQVLRDVCENHPVADHRAWKEACDDYFRLHHRDEGRGVGGLFFDHLDDPLEEVWAFVQDFGSRLAEAYLPILRRRVGTAVTPDQELWHLRRRGRYAEFNLVWDRGTRFGLQTGGRSESILASLPPRVRWDYGVEPAAGTPEAELVDVLRRPRDWV